MAAMTYYTEDKVAEVASEVASALLNGVDPRFLAELVFSALYCDGDQPDGVKLALRFAAEVIAQSADAPANAKPTRQFYWFDTDTAEDALAASILDYVLSFERGLGWALERATERRDQTIQHAREDGTAYYMGRDGTENWLVFDGGPDGKPHHFTEAEIHAAFDRVAERLRKEIGGPV